MQAAEVTADTQIKTRSPLLWVALAAMGGIVADRFGLADSIGGHWFWWIISALLLVLCFIYQRRQAFVSSAYLLLSGILCLAASWHHLQYNYFTHDNLARFASEVSQPVCVEVVTIDRTTFSPAPPFNPLRALPAQQRSEVVVRVMRIRNGTQWQTATGTCRLRVAGQRSEINTGDRLQAFAKFARSRSALNPGQYDWAKAERSRGRYCELFSAAPECVSVIQPASYSKLGRWRDALASQCQNQLAHYVGTQQSDLALAIMLGQRELLNQNTRETFFKTGTIHLLVVSGLHVGILATAVWLVIRGLSLSKTWAIVITATLVIAYATIVGGRPPVVRASILIVLALIALLSMRRTSMKNLLAAAALGVLAYNPSELFRSGTQLSFLCVAALVAYGSTIGKPKPLDPLNRVLQMYHDSWLTNARRWFTSRFGQLTAASLIVWLVAAPLVAHHFHITTPISILITPILWPLVAVALFSGLMICTFGWILPTLASLFGLLCALCLSGVRMTVAWAEQFNIGSIYLPGPATWWLVVFYAGLAMFALSALNQIGWKMKLSSAALWIAIGLAASLVTRQADQLRCTFLSVGHGTCVVLELPNQQTILYDAGSLGSPDVAAETIASYLWSRGITRIDAAVLSHADVDHYNAIPGLMDRFELGVVYVSPLMFDPWATQGKLTAPEFLRETLNEANIPLKQVWMNDRLQTANPAIEIEVLHPSQFGSGGQDNANSILLYVRYAGHSILLPGDLESPGIEAVTAEAPLDCDILLAPHHGSSRSDPPGFAAWCTPDWVVVSGRHQDDDQLLTSASYREVGAQVLHTSDCGAATFKLDRQGIEMSSFRKINP